MLIRGDARCLPLADACVECVVTSPPYWGLRDYGAHGQLGLEASPDAYVAEIVTVFREVRRVLKPMGTCWLNLGDCYQGGDRGGYSRERSGVSKNGGQNASDFQGAPNRFPLPGLKAKDLVGVPWRVAFALQADGWYLRSDIIWAKPNPMPESVTDRPTKAHEYLFLLTKSERYYYDAQAIAESVSEAMRYEMARGYDGLGLKDYNGAGVQNPSSVKTRIIANARKKEDDVGKRQYTGFNARWDASIKSGAAWEEEGGEDEAGSDSSPTEFQGKTITRDAQDAQRRMLLNVARARDNGAPHDHPFGLTRNRRTVWTIPTMPYSGAHFATMPEALVEPCILAGCPLGGLVLDPFVGSGTVVSVAERLGRRGVGVDLSYQDLAKERTAQRGLRFGEATA